MTYKLCLKVNFLWSVYSFRSLETYWWQRERWSPENKNLYLEIRKVLTWHSSTAFAFSSTVKSLKGTTNSQGDSMRLKLAALVAFEATNFTIPVRNASTFDIVSLCFLPTVSMLSEYKRQFKSNK